MTDRILTTHVGSLIRPPELVPYLAALEDGHGVEGNGFDTALRTAVDDVVRRQVDTGLDIIDDGEFGKTSWITYFYGRVGGIEERSVALHDTNALPPDLDREAFAEYYDGHDVAQAPDVSAGHTGAAEHAVGTASTGHGRQWGVHGSAHVQQR
jgi:5-methyltetrahydropteroyltriglutamate--homocysteine methyltransferase